jgi:hypothetical protein
MYAFYFLDVTSLLRLTQFLVLVSWSNKNVAISNVQLLLPGLALHSSFPPRKPRERCLPIPQAHNFRPIITFFSPVRACTFHEVACQTLPPLPSSSPLTCKGGVCSFAAWCSAGHTAAPHHTAPHGASCRSGMAWTLRYGRCCSRPGGTCV